MHLLPVVIRITPQSRQPREFFGCLAAKNWTGVMAHEMGHVRNRDILIGTIAATIAGAISMLANMAQWAMIFGGGGRRDDHEGAGGMIGGIAMIILAPIAARLSRWRFHGPVNMKRMRPAPEFAEIRCALASALGTSGGNAANSDGCQSCHSSHVYREPASRWRSREPFQHASADGRAHRSSGSMVYGQPIR